MAKNFSCSLMGENAPKFDNWPSEIDSHFTSIEAQRLDSFIFLYWSCFAFNLHDVKRV